MLCGNQEGMKVAARIILSLALLSLFGTACGYQLQGTRNPLAEVGIHKIFVEGFRNQTNRPGLEHFFSTAMVREIRRAGVFTLTNDRKSADAILQGKVLSADDAPSAAAVKLGDGTEAAVATSFAASVSVRIDLKDQDGRTIFSEVVGGTKIHPASLVISERRLVDQYANSTAPLINESEQRLAIRYLSEQMMFDAYQKMVEVF